ncbi:MAG TPA: hypothetical protein VGG89_15440 [Candidatus Baltobacteraceae bacterium]
MRAMVWAPLAAFAIMGLGFAPLTTVAATPATATTPTPNPKKDPCGATKSKWEHLQCMNFNGSAPGDEYFGRMKLSYLGIDNTFKDGVVSAGAYTTDQRLISKLMFADDALRAWEKKYPNDPQLARSYFFGEAVWRKVYTQDGQHLAWEYIQELLHKFPNSFFGKNMKLSLVKNGFTEHWFALPQTCPTPLPTGVMPETEPVSTPSPTPAPGQPAVNIITPPCVQPPSPSPNPYASPSGSPSPTPKGSKKTTPSPSPSPSPTPVAYPSGYKSPGALPDLSPSPSPSPSKHP